MKDYLRAIKAGLKNRLTETNMSVGTKIAGKVRDRYELGDKIIFITTDRQSAFDRILTAIPFKGQVLNQTSAWWFGKTEHIIRNHVVATPDPNVTVGTKCTIFPVEFVVRGYITGTTDTALWTHYQNGSRDYCGNKLPDGLKKNQKLERAIITPTTKEKDHDRPITPAEIISEGLMSREDWEFASQSALELFLYGQDVANSHGLILVDTKYEMGKDADGNILLVDEIHTPDSSRFWLLDSYEERFTNGEEPENIDKEFLRIWFVNNCDPYNDKVIPDAPEDLVIELSRRYIQLYEMITGQNFSFPNVRRPVAQRIEENVASYLCL